MIYIDSSVLLAIYLDQPGADKACALLDRKASYVSSVLLAIEVPIVLGRELSREPKILAQMLAALDADIEKISLVYDLAEIARKVRRDPRFRKCRSLDAIHGATALLLQEASGHVVEFATFDRRLAEVVVALNLTSALG